MQLSPQAKASKTPPTWDEIVDRAMKLSASQNSGKADMSRFCQPENKTCAIAVSFINSAGKSGFLKIVQDINGKTIRREACEFNEYKDVRSCFDWDTSVKHRDMKNVQGDWIKIADE
jgi:hypothetical protein